MSLDESDYLLGEVSESEAVRGNNGTTFGGRRISGLYLKWQSGIRLRLRPHRRPQNIGMSNDVSLPQHLK